MGKATPERTDGPKPKAATPGSSRTGHRVFFTARDDIILLKEVLLELPYQYKYGNKMASWAKVAKRFNEITQQRVGGQSCHERTDR
ncbi:hypothetical protein H4R35_006922, partial [Dimargaris xerosporica]